MLKFIHAADFHLDSAFAALTPQQAAARRRESRDLPVRLANYVNQNGIELVLLAGDLFDSADAYRDTAESLSAALGQMAAQAHIQIILRHRTLKICGYVENSTHIHRRITTVDNSQFACNRPDLTKITICKKVPSLTGRDLSGKASTQRFSC